MAVGVVFAVILTPENHGGFVWLSVIAVHAVPHSCHVVSACWGPDVVAGCHFVPAYFSALCCGLCHFLVFALIVIALLLECSHQCTQILGPGNFSEFWIASQTSLFFHMSLVPQPFACTLPCISLYGYRTFESEAW